MNKKTINKSKKKKVNIDNRKGFTLIELLATISVLSLVTTIVVFTAVSIIDGTKQKTYDVTINNIEKYTSSYILEEGNSINWLNGVTSDYQYQCLTVQRLIDTGYFTGDILDSYVSENKTVDANNYVYVERDTKTKTLTRNILLVNDRVDSYSGLCSDIVAGAYIGFSVSPDGWSLDKEIAINYNIYNNLDNVSNYKYNYKFDEIELEKQFNKQKMIEDVIVEDNGTLVANIKDKGNNPIISNILLVDKIDRIGPIISLNNRMDKTVRGNATISLVVDDDRSGVDESSFVTNDIVVYIGNNLLDSEYELRKIDENNYEVSIENYNYAGEVHIIIDNNKVLDLLGNGNVDTEISTGIIFDNTYTIKYNANGGTGSMTDTVCTYGSNCTIKNNGYSKTGYTFDGWTTNADGTGTKWSNWDGSSWIGWSGKWEYDEDDDYGISNGVLQLYARWKVNKVSIKYRMNGDWIQSPTTQNVTTSTWSYDSNNMVNKNGQSYNETIEYGKMISFYGLSDYNNYEYINIFKNGYHGKSGAEWICVSDNCKDKTYDQFANTYQHSDFCDASNGDCEVVIQVNWEPNTYTIKYNANGGTGSMTNTVCTYGSNCTVSNNGYSKTGYTFAGWTTKADGSDGGYEWSNSDGNSWIGWSGEWKYVNGDYGISNGVLQLYARWNLNYKEVTTNNKWFIWSAPRLMWRENTSKVINGIVAWDANGKPVEYNLSNDVNSTSYNYQYNYAMGTWTKDKKVLVCVDNNGKVCDSDLDYVQNSSSGLAFLKVWIQETDINKYGTYGCLYNGTNTLPMSSCTDTTSMTYNNKTYWSVWVSRYAEKDGGYSIKEWEKLF